VSTEGYCNEHEMESFAAQTRAIKAKFTSYFGNWQAQVQTTSKQ